jgi:hypothetical protein
LFAYASNSPINLIDRYGLLDCKPEFGNLTEGARVGNTWIEEEPFMKWNAKGIYKVTQVAISAFALGSGNNIEERGPSDYKAWEKYLYKYEVTYYIYENQRVCYEVNYVCRDECGKEVSRKPMPKACKANDTRPVVLDHWTETKYVTNDDFSWRIW